MLRGGLILWPDFSPQKIRPKTDLRDLCGLERPEGAGERFWSGLLGLGGDNGQDPAEHRVWKYNRCQSHSGYCDARLGSHETVQGGCKRGKAVD